MTTSQSIHSWLYQNSKEFCAISDEIWDLAETGYQEKKSAALLADTLKRHGFAIESGLAGIPTAFCASFGTGEPTIGFLAEYDALSGMSQQAAATEKLHGEQADAGHGCGHHLLGAGVAAAAVAVSCYLAENHLAGTIKVFGCPAEENGSGKAFLARAGVFDTLGAALTWHPGDTNAVLGASTLANIETAFRFTGVSAHAAAAPHLGRSALDAVELMNVGANFLREHIVSDARLHYAITNAGGHSPNVVPAQAEVLYLVRAAGMKELNEIYERVCDIAKGAALMTGTKMEMRFVKACSGLRQNKTLQQLLWETMQQVSLPSFSEKDLEDAKAFIGTYCAPGQSIGAQNLRMLSAMLGKAKAAELAPLLDAPLQQFLVPYKSSDFCMPASTDVGDVSQICPTAQFGTATFATGTPGHSWQLVAQGKLPAAHKGMMHAAEILASAAVQMFKQPQLLEQTKKEHDSCAEAYLCPIPAQVAPPVNG